MVNNWPNIIQDWLYPPTCLLCGDGGYRGLDLCAGCLISLPLNTTACQRCGLSLSVDGVCGQCLTKAPSVDGTLALFRYEEPVRHLIHALKFRADYACARLLGNLLAEALGHRADTPGCLIPVPLHRSRYRERGFNQAAEIARRISVALEIPIDLHCCERRRATHAQAELSADERSRNLRGAFVCHHSPISPHVAIVDDVVTTGATVNELAKALRKAGARRIEVLACARA